MLVPNPGFRNLYTLLSKLRSPPRLEPEVRALGLRLKWVEHSCRDGALVSVRQDSPRAPPCAHFQENGALVMAKRCSTALVLALRNLAADPDRRFRRFGFDTQACPFCGVSLPYDTLESGLGHCRRCGDLLGWPFDQFTVDRADKDLRNDSLREIAEDENGAGDPLSEG